MWSFYPDPYNYTLTKLLSVYYHNQFNETVIYFISTVILFPKSTKYIEINFTT